MQASPPSLPSERNGTAMHRSVRLAIAFGAVAITVFVVYRSVEAQSSTIAVEAPTLPPDRSLARPSEKPRAPRPHPLSLVCAIVEADVTGVRFEYDDWKGPRTISSLGNLKVHA